MKELFGNITGSQLSISAVLTAAAALFHRVPFLLLAFMGAVIIDYITGFTKAKFFTKDWNSQTGVKGIVKKVMYFALIATAFLVGYTIREIGAQTGNNLEYAMLLGWYTLAVMLLNELTSILENLYVMMPDKVPIWLIKSLKIADGTIDKKINGLVCRNQKCEACDLKDRCNERKATKEE